MSNRKIEVNFVNVKKGHDNYIISKKITHVYYILKGRGFFNIKGKRYDVKPGMLIEVPPKVEYVYSGKMKLLLIMNPRWFKSNEIITKKNPFVK